MGTVDASLRSIARVSEGTDVESKVACRVVTCTSTPSPAAPMGSRTPLRAPAAAAYANGVVPILGCSGVWATGPETCGFHRHGRNRSRSCGARTRTLPNRISVATADRLLAVISTRRYRAAPCATSGSTAKALGTQTRVVGRRRFGLGDVRLMVCILPVPAFCYWSTIGWAAELACPAAGATAVVVRRRAVRGSESPRPMAPALLTGFVVAAVPR